jgi:hypothetical protein
MFTGRSSFPSHIAGVSETAYAPATPHSLGWRRVLHRTSLSQPLPRQWDRDVPGGAKLHVSGFGDDGLHVTDVWESEQAFNAFMAHRLAPAIQEIGIQGQPEVKFFPLHGVFAPALGGSEQVSDL